MNNITMSRQVRDVFILSGLIALYGLALWLYESKLTHEWSENFPNEPHAIHNHQVRDALIEEEMNALPLEVSDGAE